MEVAESYHLAQWFQKHGQAAARKYQALLKIMEANLSQNNQSQKQPIREAWHDLFEELKNMPLTELNFQQLHHLEELGVSEYIGDVGARYVRRTVKESSYDPATGVEGIKTAHSAINSAIQQFSGLQQALDAIRLAPASMSEGIDEDQDALARIQFTSEASINNVADLKKWSNDWNDIVRGVGLCVGETPHNVKVVGASRGSILVWIGGTMLFVSFLAHMSRKVSEIVLNGLQVAEAIEDLRHKKISNAAIEKAMRDQQKEREDNIERELIDELKQKAVEFQPEHEAHLKAAVKKFINFNKKGGVVDYIEPSREEGDTGGDDENDTAPENPAAAVTQELRELISEIRSMKSQAYLIEHKEDEVEDDDDGDAPE